jgi:hypothetical protein
VGGDPVAAAAAAGGKPEKERAAGEPRHTREESRLNMLLGDALEAAARVSEAVYSVYLSCVSVC